MLMDTAHVLAASPGGTKFWPYNVVRNKVAFPIANVPAVRAAGRCPVRRV
ncbi:MAG: hypothetical protein R2854_31040 [Caldilineaceae bacterium]